MVGLLVTIVLFVLSCTGISSQEIALEASPSEPCKKDLRSGIDKYNITGTVGPDFFDFVNKGWSFTITVKVFSSSLQEETLCPIAILSPSSCKPQPGGICYCDHIDPTTGSAHIVVRSIAKESQSQGIVHGEWEQNNNGTIFSRTKNTTLPHIYDVNAANLNLTVNDIAAVEANGFCGGSLAASGNYTLKLCCSSTASPCYPRIAIDGHVVAENQTDCVTFTSNKTNGRVNVTKSYSVCSSNDYITRSSCLIEEGVAYTTITSTYSSTTLSDVVTTTTATTTNLSNGTDVVTTTTAATINSSDVTDVVTTTTAATINSSDVTDVVTTTTAATTNSSDVTVVPPKVVPLELILGLVFGILAAICIIAAIIIYTFWYKKHRKPHNIIRETHPKQHLDPLCTDGSTPNATGNGGRINPKDFDEKGKKGDDTQPVEQKKVTSPRPTKTEKGHNGNNSHDGKPADPQSETNKQENKIAEKITEGKQNGNNIPDGKPTDSQTATVEYANESSNIKIKIVKTNN